MVRNYEKDVVRFQKNYKGIIIPTEKIERINNFAEQLVKQKQNESHHLTDNGQEFKRKVTGLMGEAALEILLGIEIIDWTLGDSNSYHNPDIPGYNVGIKTVERNKYPVIFKKNRYPQIICVKSNKQKNVVFVCGLATAEVLNSYQDIDLLLSPKLKARGTKTGFYGFEHLTPITSLEDLKQYRIK